MYRQLCIGTSSLLLPSGHLRHLHSLALDLKQMTETSRVGQTRTQPDSERSISSQPAEKKPRLEDATDAISLTSKPFKAKTTSLKHKKKRKQNHGLPEPFSPEDVLWRDVEVLLGKDTVAKAIKDGTEWDSPFDFREEAVVEVSTLSSSGAYSIAAAWSLDRLFQSL